MLTQLIRNYLKFRNRVSRMKNWIFFLVFFYLSNRVSTIYTTEYLYKDTENLRKNNIKYILYWNTQNWFYKGDLSQFDLKNLGCPETRCIITKRRDIKSYQDFDALLFHIPTLTGERPRFRNRKQIYIFADLESAWRFARNTKNINGYFNITSEI
jgi:hypothetical protein